MDTAFARARQQLRAGVRAKRPRKDATKTPFIAVPGGLHRTHGLRTGYAGRVVSTGSPLAPIIG